MNNELLRAKREVERSRLQVETALNHLEEKISDGYRKVDEIVFKVKTPYRLAKQNPVASFGVFVLAGFVLGALFSKPKSRAAVGAKNAKEPHSTTLYTLTPIGSIPSAVALSPHQTEGAEIGSLQGVNDNIVGAGT